MTKQLEVETLELEAMEKEEEEISKGMKVFFYSASSLIGMVFLASSVIVFF